jgi:hypothetical protein
VFALAAFDRLAAALLVEARDLGVAMAEWGGAR